MLKLNLYSVVRPLLFALPPEFAHTVTLNGLRFLLNIKLIKPKQFFSPCQVMGLQFPNPVGLAAGLDKNGEYIDALAALGFGFIEVGTVTPMPQSGNPKPRLFRITKAQALINRLGFNNKGVAYLIEQIKKTKYKGILGINIGKNLTTPVDKAIDDYLFCMRAVYNYASYITINLSSPNTPGLRDLQFGKHLTELLSTLKKEQQDLQNTFHKYVPLVIKISPDLAISELTEIAAALLKYKIDGVIATNTTISRREIQGLRHATEQGGLSGQPLFSQATLITYELQKLLQNKIPIIGVGGIMNAENATEKFKMGANLIQLYTGLIYKGPQLITNIEKNLK